MKYALFIVLLAQSSMGWALLPEENHVIGIYKSTVPSVVNVSNIKVASSLVHGMIEIPTGAGSGYVWDQEGHIVTNFHVIDNGDSFVVSFANDQKKYKAKLVGGEPKKDIAVLKLIEKPKNLVPIKIGKSKELQIGQMAIAIGSPFGLDHTMTKGTVSALGRKVPGFGGVTIQDMIQTDAAINPGNSGGPLINSSGELVGMNTQIYSQSGASVGIGFAVPSDTINGIVPQIIKHGKVIRPGLGIGVLPEHIKRNYFGPKGVAISHVDDNAPAGKAGLEGLKRDPFGNIYAGDIILSIDDVEVNSIDDIYHKLDQYKIGDEITVKYKRKDKTLTTKLKLTAL